MLWIIRSSGFVLLMLTLLPLLSTGAWYVRWWDFPLLQIASLLLVLLTVLAFHLLSRGWTNEVIVWMALLLIAFSWQTSHIIPFSKVWPLEIPAAGADVATEKLMVVNLQYDNAQPAGVPGEIEAEDPELLLFLEIDDPWQKHLADLSRNYPYRHDHIRGEGLGMALWSKFPITSVETRHLVSDRRASIWAKFNLHSGHVVNFVGVHPTPPGLRDATGDSRRDSRVRDAELVRIAKEIAERNDEAWIVAGDFNDVAWSHTTRLFKRISGLKDPRIGRTFMGTYIAQYPPCRCPIDHVFLSEGFSIADLSRKRIPGSDHFAVLASIGLQNTKGTTPHQHGDDQAEAREIIEEGESDAESRDVASDDALSTAQ